MKQVQFYSQFFSLLVLSFLSISLSAQDVKLTSDPVLGQVLTDDTGNTLYFFTKDSEPNNSSCMGGCLSNWPVFHASNLSVGMGLDAADFEEFERADGVMQTTYKGWPLYYFANDNNAGETNGEAVNNIWFVAKPDYGLMLMDDELVGKDGMTYDSNYELGSEVVQFFVDAEGRTIYTFKNDNYNQNNFTADDFSNNGVWPIYEFDLQSIPSTLDESLFGSITVAGHTQMTYKGWPLYYFGQDAARGETKGVSVPSPGIWPVAVEGADAATQELKLTSDPVLGQVLTDGIGNTLYFFTKDSEPNNSSCMGGCLSNWPVFHASNLSVGMGLDAADFEEFERADGVMQTTYKGWPLYYFANDNNAGETNGEAVNNIWFVAKPDYGLMLMDDELVGKDGMTYDSNYELGSEVVQFFVDAEGRTIYTFKNDNYNQNNFTADDFSNNGVWPIYEFDLQSIPSTLDESLFGSITVAGHTQMTYKGWPLYYFGQDAARGETKGVSVPSPGVWPVAVDGVDNAIVGVNEILELIEFEVSPNPFHEEIAISLDFKTNTEITIVLYNSIGQEERRIVRRFNSGKNSLVLRDLNSLEKGVYFLKIQDQTRGVSTQILIHD